MEVLYHPDLGATVYAGEAPESLAAELDDLYSSLFSTMDWFVTHDDAQPTSACVLDDPRHVLFFDQDFDTIRILNKAFIIAPEDMGRACASLFRTFPEVRRIHVEVMFAPRLLASPHRVLYWTDHMMIDLPHSFGEYFSSLGKSTRKKLHSAQNRLRRQFPEMTTQTIVVGDRGPELLERFLEWKVTRFRERNAATYWEESPRLAQRFVALLERRGEAEITSLNDRLVAITFNFPVGDTMCMQEWAFDPEFARASLGSVSQLSVIEHAMERGLRRINMLWGDTEHKARFGAAPRRATAVSVFRSRRDGHRYVREGARVARARLRVQWDDLSSRSLTAARRLVSDRSRSAGQAAAGESAASGTTTGDREGGEP
jgi:CelD/BcsL family acetyltransferase involved in cellulose biosynthesis